MNILVKATVALVRRIGLLHLQHGIVFLIFDSHFEGSTITMCEMPMASKASKKQQLSSKPRALEDLPHSYIGCLQPRA